MNLRGLQGRGHFWFEYHQGTGQSIGNVSILFSFPFRKFKEPSFPIAAKDSADLYEYVGGEGRPMKSPETEWANRCAGAPSEVSAEPSWEQVVVNTAKRMGQLLRWERDESAVRVVGMKSRPTK